MYFFTSDEHYGHHNVIKYCNRPFDNIDEMNAELIRRHNTVITSNDVVVHAGDFCWSNKKEQAVEFIKKLNGNHIFLRGSHDHWMPKSVKFMWRKLVEGQFVVVCHYAMRTWERSHYGSWDLHGHSHGRMESIGKQYDIGVDNNDFYPVSFEQLKVIMEEKEVHHEDYNRSQK